MHGQKNIKLNIKGYYERYYNILSIVIKEAKKRHYDIQIKNSTNKNKTTRNIVKKKHTEKCIVQTLNS